MDADSGPVTRDTARRVLERVSVPGLGSTLTAEWSVTPIEAGFNDVFTVGPIASSDPAAVVKFATYSRPEHFRAGVAAYRLLAAHTELPVPKVYAFVPDPVDAPPFVVLEYLPGESLVDGYRDVSPAAARAVGAVISECGRIPESAAEGYGGIRSSEAVGGRGGVVAEYDDCTNYLLAYADMLYDSPPEHDALASIAPSVPEHLRVHRDRLPSEPAPAVVVTDFSPENLHTLTGRLPERGVPDGLTAVLDLERAKIAPLEFMAVNAEYLMTRYLSDPHPVTHALYESLPFGPDVPARDLYRLIALGRSVSALPVWYDPAGEEYRHRGTAVAREIESLLEG